MAWVVDTCLLIDVAEADPAFGVASAALIDSKRAKGWRCAPSLTRNWLQCSAATPRRRTNS